MGLEFNPLMEVDRTLPHAEADGTDIDPRIGRYREQYVLNLYPTLHGLSDEGTYNVTTNPTPGTGLAFAINTGVSETAGYFLNIKNNDIAGAADAVRLYIHYIRIICTVVPASATSGHFMIKTSEANRFTSGGTQLVNTSPNTDSSAISVAVLNAGALTTAGAGVNDRLVARGVLRTAIPVVFDEWILAFGPVDSGGAILLGGATAQRMVIPCAPLVIGPGKNVGLQIWFPGNAATAMSAELEVGWWER